MSTNSRFAVAVHTLVALAHVGEVMTSEKLASGTVNTNPVVLRRILSRLAQAGIVEAQAGKSGGFQLARNPSEIDLSDVWLALDDGGVFGLHANPEVSSCAVSCSIKAVLSGVFESTENAMRESLAQTSLADLVSEVRKAERRNKRMR